MIIFLLLGSAFCSSSEAAIFSAPKIRLQISAKQGDLSAQNLLSLKENMSKTIGTLVILTNLFNIVGSILVGAIADDLFDNFALGIFSAVFTFLVILFAEVLPKNFGEKNAVSFGIFVAPFVIFLSRVFHPFLYILELLSRSLVGSTKKYSVSEDEIKFMAHLGMQEQSIEKDEQELILNVFKMNDKSASNIMTPRVNIYALDGNLTLEAQKNEIYNSPHSRLMVFGQDYDDIKGFVLIREILHALAENGGDKTPMEFIHPILTLKENTRVDSLLIIFQKKRSHIALVIDDFGGTSGLVTLEDVLEELVGEIMDETDLVSDMRDVKYHKEVRETSEKVAV